MEVGFIGLGLMGQPMALHLEAAGHRLHLWARRPESLAPFAAVNAKLHASPAALAAASEIVITMVADAPDVDAVCLGADGIASGGKAGWVVVDMSTIAPAEAIRIGLASARLASTITDMSTSVACKYAVWNPCQEPP